MVNKKFLLGMLVLTLVFGIFVTGCSSLPTNYYNLGDVSEGNCALVLVSPVRDTFYDTTTGDTKNDISSDFQIVSFVQIDGKGSTSEWEAPKSNNMYGQGHVFGPQTYVRVTPGEHTFTMQFIRDNRRVPASITYNCKAGKRYYFTMLAKVYNTAIHTGINFPTMTTIIINEYDINEVGKVYKASLEEVARKSEVHDGFNDGELKELRLRK